MGRFSADLTTRYRVLLAGSNHDLFSILDAKTVQNWKMLFCHSSEAILLKSFDDLFVFSSRPNRLMSACRMHVGAWVG